VQYAHLDAVAPREKSSLRRVILVQENIGAEARYSGMGKYRC
jgi:hypothetical protein